MGEMGIQKPHFLVDFRGVLEVSIVCHWGYRLHWWMWWRERQWWEWSDGVGE